MGRLLAFATQAVEKLFVRDHRNEHPFGAAKMVIPAWLDRLRRQEIVNVVNQHPTTRNNLILGLPKQEVFDQVIGGGQAEFDTPYLHLSGADRALLYAYMNQPGHVAELIEAFTQLFKNGPPEDPLIVVDLGCGPCTGGLALAAVLDAPFTYIGLDRYASMRDFGERLASAAEGLGVPRLSERQWAADFDSIEWTRPSGWRPILIIASYLLASPTLDVSELVRNMDAMCTRFGRGPVTVLYTNSCLPDPNRSFPAFRDGLQEIGFRIIADDTGAIIQSDRIRPRPLRYALFQRDPQTVLNV